MNKVYDSYRKGGFTIVGIHYDNELHEVLDSFAAKQTSVIKMNYDNTQKHVPRAERNNHKIQERVWLNYYQLPYTHLPRILVKYMVSEAPKKLNYVPAKHGVSKHHILRMILHKENLDFDRHCKYVLGDCVQTYEDENVTNNNAVRSLDCLYSRPTVNHQGRHELLHLQKIRVITRSMQLQLL